MVWSKAGSEVGPLDAIPRRWVTEWGGLAPVGIASLRCDPLTLSHILAGRGADYREHGKTGGRVWPPVSCVLAMSSGLVLESAV